ncbi:uncharacterized protein [Lolium perenne]|uniref:uncharacterized protein n=1 Tax=Lolium perenne TaxID=4522 RepID=UPI0021F66163|nr:uncharacterized protein LOC127305952 [Lolium perenne]
MGKAKAGQAAGDRPGSAAHQESPLPLCGFTATIGKALSAKCVAALFLGVGVFLSALFLLLHLRAPGSVPDDPGTLIGGIQASFILSKPPAQLASHVTMLEEEIYQQIGVPNTKVSVSMQTLKDVTYVRFSILPDTMNTSISAQYMQVLRNNLIQLTLQQLNLSLTPSVFGDPFCVEVLGFPGGITMEVEHPQQNSTVDPAQPFFSMTLDLSIRQLRRLIQMMKKSFGHMLEQEIYIDLTNKNGSTIAPPTTVKVFISPNDRSIYQDPNRLKQLAETIMRSNSRNLGLNAAIFGRIKDLWLAPCLQRFVPSFAPSSSPAPIPSPSMPPYSQPTPTNLCEQCLCPDWLTTQDATIPHRKLMHFPPTAVFLQVSTQLHSRNAPGSRKNGIAVPAPTFIAPSSQ